MKKTELVFILDRSGSMRGMEDDTIGGFNAMLDKQRALGGECHITTVLFDHEYELLHDGIAIADVAPITRKQYEVRGSTALLDAIGRTIQRIDGQQERWGRGGRAAKVLFVIITDGYENASTHYSSAEVKRMIEHQKKAQDWEFIFLGANIDAVETARHYGIDANRAVDFHADKKGMHVSFETMADTVSLFRSQEAIPEDWNARIRADYEGRRAKK